MTFCRGRLKWLFLLLLAGAVCLGHPHSFIDYKFELHFDLLGLTGIRANWWFDEMFSSYVKTYDENQDGAFNDTELKMLKKEAFDNLKDYDYFSTIYINDKPFKVEFVKDFSAVYEGHQIKYSFLIPCHVTALPTGKSLVVMFFDPTYYIDVAPVKESAVSVDQAGNMKVDIQRVERKEDAYYQKMIIPEGHLIQFKRQ